MLEKHCYAKDKNLTMRNNFTFWLKKMINHDKFSVAKVFPNS